MKKEQNKPFKKLTFKNAIRAKCLQCTCGSPSEVKTCPCTDCALWGFRFGKAPKPDINALDLLIFPEDPESTIFSVRRKDTEEDEPRIRTKEYSMFIGDEDE